MSATREHRNMGAIEDSIASVGTAITVAEHLAGVVGSQLPDDAPNVHVLLADLREAHNRVCEQLGV